MEMVHEEYKSIYYTAALHAFYKVVLLLLLVHAGSCERVPSQENSW